MKFSIIIPAYKSKFFDECIQSVLSQTFVDFELVILNDSSPEPIKEIVLHYHDSRIRYYENEKNVGAKDVVYNWNKLLDLAKGDYLICMGDDDKLYPNCLFAYNELLSRYPSKDIYHCRTQIIDEHSNPLDIQEERPLEESMLSMIWHMMFKGRVQFIGDFLFRTESLRKMGGFYYQPYAMASDWLSTFMAAKSKGIANANELLFQYRSTSLTITSTPKGKSLWKSTIKYRQCILELLKDIPSDSIDQQYRYLILKNLDYIIAKSQVDNMATDLAQSCFKDVFYWIKHLKIMSVSKSSFCYAVLLGLYRLHRWRK
jgi:glycosyltransferase involved in cell wall biosynthesis